MKYYLIKYYDIIMETPMGKSVLGRKEVSKVKLTKKDIYAMKEASERYHLKIEDKLWKVLEYEEV